MEKLPKRSTLCAIFAMLLLFINMSDLQALSLLPPPKWMVFRTSEEAILYDCDPSECEHAISWHCTENTNLVTVKFPTLKSRDKFSQENAILYLDIVTKQVQLNSVVEVRRAKYERPIIHTFPYSNSSGLKIVLERNDPLINVMINASKNSSLASLEVRTVKFKFMPDTQQAFIPLFGVNAALTDFWEECDMRDISQKS